MCRPNLWFKSECYIYLKWGWASWCHILEAYRGEGQQVIAAKGQNKERPKTNQTSENLKGISEIYNEKCSNLAGITTHRESILLIQKEPKRPLWKFSNRTLLIPSALQSFVQKKRVQAENENLCFSISVWLFYPLSVYFKGPTIQATCWMRRFPFELLNLVGSMKTFVVEENCSLVNVDGF